MYAHRHAIVLGGSMAGLLAARVLSDHLEHVTLIERDPLPDENGPRKGVPQGRHVHGLLASGLNQLCRYFPGLRDALTADGAIIADMAERVRWHQRGAYKARFVSGYEGAFLSRTLLEQHVRRRVRALPNVTTLDATDVERFSWNEEHSRVTGVMLRAPRSLTTPALDADIVIDATGRGSRTPGWIEQAGYVRAPERSVKIDIGYATRVYRRTPDDLPDADAVIISAAPPTSRRMGVLFPAEGDRWICMLGGWHGDHAPTDPAGYLRFAEGLGAQDIHRIIARAEPISEISTHRFPSSRRCHYERLRRFPEGLLVLGDAVSSFNPSYGQGMTSAALQAAALDRLMRDRRGRSLDGLWREYFRDVARVVSIPWDVVSGEDFRFRETTGARPPLVGLINRYVGQVQKASSTDPVVFTAFLHVMNMQKVPQSVLAPRVAWRVLRAGLARWGSRERDATERTYAPVHDGRARPH
ncbi:MAG: FAD-binding monooxygenase [Gemmatimonadaceae bacterium]|nr:FAD-binding monooxygenase [Gemmatimonadaceae bacterium]